METSSGYMQEVMLHFVILPARFLRVCAFKRKTYATHNYDVALTFLSHKTFSDSDCAAA